MDEREFRAGVVGCGRIGSLYDEQSDGQGVYTHAGMYRATPGILLACGADPDPDRVRSFGRHWGCDNLFSDVQTMLEQCPVDVLSVTTPDNTHEEIIRQAVQARRPPRVVLVEKPLAATAQAGEKLLAEAEEAGVLLLVNYVRRWDEMHRNIRSLLHSDRLGTIRWVTGYYVRGIRHNGCHLVNLMRFLFGEIEQVEPVGRTDTRFLENDFSLHARVVFSSGAEGLLVALDQPGYAYSIFDLDIFGTKGRVRITANGARAELYSARQDPRFTNFKTLDPAAEIFESTYDRAMLEAGTDLVRLLREPGVDPVNHGAEAVADLQVIERLLSVCA